MVFSSSLYDTLPTRPPTPPKDLNRDLSEALDFLDDSFEVARTAAGGHLAASNVDTPPEQSPSSSAEAVTNTSGKKSKRVGFSPWTNYHKAPGSLRESTERTPKVLPPSKDKRALKSILKPLDISIPLTPTESDPGRPGYFSAHNYKSFGEMLQSVVQQLARDSRTSRLDAYMALLGTWKAYEDVPEPEAMKEKTGLFMGFIRRDLVAMRTPTDPDTQIVTQALKLLISIVCTPTLSACLDDEFKSFVIEHSTTVIGRGSSPKAMINHHLFLLAKQDFSTRLLTPNRVDKILVALQDIQDQVTGSSVVTYRLKVYEKLLCQAENAMVARIPDWLEHIFHGMLSNVKETRNCAIDVGRKAGILLGTNSQATKAVIELFKTESESGTTYGDYFGARLMKMVANKEHGPYAAQIWAVVVLFFRSQRLRLEQWPHLKPWLLIIQRCLNTSDLNTRFQALDAWNRLVFVVGPREGTSWPMRKMLRLPISTQLEKKLSSEPTKQARRMALSSYCNLLYYAFRPDASHKQLDLYWDEYVNQVLGRMACGSAHDRKMAARILTALFGRFPCQRWNESRANENSNMKPEELPRLDPRWLRQRISIVLKVVEPCLGLDPLLYPCSWDKAPGPVMWLSLMVSLCEAGSQEITASMDLKEAIAQIMNTLYRLWSNCSPKAVANDGTSTEWTTRYSVLVQSAMEKLGPMHFTDRLLSRNNRTDFEAAPTPSHRSSKHHGLLQSPILHLLDMFSRVPVQISRSDMYISMIKAALRLCCDSRISRHLKMELLKECAQQVSNAKSSGNDNAGREPIWCSIAEVTVAVMDNHSLEISERESRQFGHELRDVVKILSSGLQYPSRQCLEAGKLLYCRLVECAKRGAGDGGIVLAVVEPVSEALKVLETHNNEKITLFYASLVVEQCPQPNTRQTMDQGRKALGGVVLPPAKTAVFEPFNHSYQMIDNTLASSYKTLDSSDVESHVRFLTNLAVLFQRCPLSLSGLLLRKIQNGVAVWIEDSEQKLTGTEEGTRRIHITVVELWKKICSTTSRLPRKDSTLLKAIEPLIASGLMAQRKAIVNATIELWNTTFGAEEAIEYPLKVEGALRRLRPAVDLQLPTFPESTTDEVRSCSQQLCSLLTSQVPETLPSFLESQEDMDYLQPPSGTGRVVTKQDKTSRGVLLRLLASQRDVS
ncbi:Rap1-interacting factor 1 N terminal-domain-containing protein [Cryomyces antarcticus]